MQPPRLTRPGAPVEISQTARDLHHDALVVDLHIDTFLMEQLFGYEIRNRHQNRLPRAPIGWHVDLPRLLEAGVDMPVFGVVIKYWASGEARRTATRSYLDRFWRVVDDPGAPITFADDLETITAARRLGKIGACLGIEGAHALGEDLHFLSECYDRGARYLGLAHFANTAAATCSIGKGADETTGLTDFGRELVDEAGRLGMPLDLAHINKAGFLEATQRTKLPVFVSHTAVMARCHTLRNVDDEMIRAVAKTNGTLGVIFSTQWLNKAKHQTVEEIIFHAEYIRDLVGIDHVSFGSDFDGFVSGLPEGMRGVESYPVLTEVMLRRGWKEEEIRKALGVNAIRVLSEAKAARRATTVKRARWANGAVA